MSAEGNSAGFVCKRLFNALRELDMLILSYSADRDLRVSTVQRFCNARGKMYKKAQRAAVLGDEDARAMMNLFERKKRLLEHFAKVWDLYAGEGTGEIVGYYIQQHGNIGAVQKKYKPKSKVDEALATWYDFVRVSSALARDRMHEAEFKGRTYDAQWYLEIGKKESDEG